MSVNILLKRSATASKRPVGASMAFGELNLNYDAATGGLFYKDTLGAVVKVGPCQVSASAPNSSPAGSSGNSAGEFWFDTTTSTLKLYDGSAWVEAGGMVQGVTSSAPITVDNSDPLNPVIGASAASTSAPGVVQLNDTTSSTSTTEALTANQGRSLQQQIDALIVSSNLTLAGTLNASTGNLVTVTTEGTAQGFVIGSPLPSPAAGNAEFFVIATVGATSYTPPGGSATEVHVGDWFLSSGTVWNFLDVGFQAAYASTTSPGIVQLATDAEVQAGVDTEHVVVSSSLQSKLSDSVSTTSSTTIASSTAAKSAYDAGIQGQTDAATALGAANAAQSTADQAVLDAADAQSTADQAVSDAGAAQTDATQALSDASAAQGTANTAVAAAAAAQSTANAAMPLSGGTFTNDVTFSAGPGLGIIVTLGTITPGSGYPSGVYSGMELVGGTGVAAIADITVGLSGEVTNVDLIDGGIDYTVGDVLTANIVDGGGWSVPVATTSSPVGAVFTIDNPSTLLNNGSLVQNGRATFNDQLSINGEVFFSDTTQTYFDPGSTIGFNGTAEVNGSLTFNAGSTANFAIAPAFEASLTVGSPGTSYTLPVSDGAADYILSTDGAGNVSWVVQSEGDVTSVSGNGPITVDNTDPQNPIVGIDAASTTASGAVQLNDTVLSTSTTEAATANAAKTAYDAAIAAASAGDVSGIASNTVIFVNSTDGNNSTGQRGTTKAFLTITAALAVALNGDTIFLSPGTFTENVTLTKGVNMVGTYNEQGLPEGTSILGNFVFDIVNPVATVNPTLNHIRFISPNTSNAFKVLNNSFGSGGIATINDCAFTQAGDSSITEFAFETTGTWSRSLYVRRATFDGNVKHAAGTAAGASGYLVLDDILATGSALRHYDISTGTAEFRRPSNGLSPVLQTGGVVLFTDCISGITPSNATTSPIFGGTNICYKGSAAALGVGTVYFNGYAPITGVVNIGANMIYGWSALNVTPANLIISGSAVAYTTAVPAAAAVVTASQQRPRFDLLTATSSVAAANQLATVVDSANGTLYTVSALDAGTF